jgi:hypothetical protein
MRETSQHSLSEPKKRFSNFRNCAALYAVFAPLVCLILLPILLVLIGGSPIIYRSAALIFMSSLMMGVLSLFGHSVPHKGRVLVLFGILVSGVCGGIACLILSIGESR